MKKKLEAELISIAHRILKLKNRGEIAQLQEETLKLYEKLSVLRFVEDNFSDVKPTIGYASAEEKLEEIYGLDEVSVEEEKKKGGNKKTNDIKEEGKAEEPVKAEKAEDKTDDIKQEDSNDESADVGEGEAVSEEEIEYTEEETDEEETAKEDPQPETEQEEVEKESEHEEVKEEEQPEPETKHEAPKAEEVKSPKESLFEGFEDYIEPEFVKKSDIAEPNNINIEFLPKEPEIIAKQEEQAEQMWEEPKQEEPNNEKEVKEEPKQEEKSEPILDWRDWEPSKSVHATKAEEPKKDDTKKSLNDTFGKTITLGLNDRIAFEKNLFGGSSEDLNRVVSQLNTLNTFTEAKDFIEDLVKPDYNYWKGKEEYEERFMALVEKRFE